MFLNVLVYVCMFSFIVAAIFCAFVYVFAYFGTYLHAFACFISICVILRPWGALGALLGRSWAFLGRLWTLWAGFGIVLEALGMPLEHSWEPLERSWDAFGDRLAKKTEKHEKNPKF